MKQLSHNIKYNFPRPFHFILLSSKIVQINNHSYNGHKDKWVHQSINVCTSFAFFKYINLTKIAFVLYTISVQKILHHKLHMLLKTLKPIHSL